MKNLEYIRKELDEFEFSSRELTPLEVKELQTLITEIQKNGILGEPYSNVLFILGYIYYNFGEYIGGVDPCLEYFNECISIDSDHNRCFAYLGYYYYDIGEYENASNPIKKALQIGFPKYKLWESLKLEELLLCCEIRLGQMNINNIENFLNKLLNTDFEDRAVPQELFESLNAVWSSLDFQKHQKLYCSLGKLKDLFIQDGVFDHFEKQLNAMMM